jgi:hypothetical protein
MSAAWFRLRIELRRGGWFVVAGMVLLLGVTGGTVLVAAAGARRGASAFERLQHQTRASTILVNPNWRTDDDVAARVRSMAGQVRSLPGVDAATTVMGLVVVPAGARADRLDGLAFLAGSDEASLRDVDVPVVRAGRLPHQDRPDEAFANPAGAAAAHLHVGDSLDVVAISATDMRQDVQSNDQLLAEVRAGRLGTRHRLRLVGIGETAGDVVPGAELPSVLLTSAFQRRDHLEPAFAGLGVRLAPSTDGSRFIQRVQSMEPTRSIDFQTLAADRDTVHRAVTPHVVALAIFAVVLLIGAMAAVGQTFARRAVGEARDDATLDAVGMRFAERRLVDWMRLGIVLVGGIVLAVVGAILASPAMPVGVARSVEPNPGVSVDWVVLAPGALLLAVAVGGASVLATLRAVRPRTRVARRTRTTRWIDTPTTSRPAGLGIRFAFRSTGRLGGTRPATTIVTAGLAVALVTGSLTFAASLARFVDTPSAYGNAFDADAHLADAPPNQQATYRNRLGPALVQRRDVAAVSELYSGAVHLSSGVVPGDGIRFRKGRAAAPTLVAGRLPDRTGEVALGASTMRAEGVGLGGRVTMTDAAGHARRERVVGQVVLPGIEQYTGSDEAALGVGALLPLRELVALTGVRSPDGPTAVLVNLRRGTSIAALRTSIARRFGPDAFVVLGPHRPADVTSVRRVQSAPTVLAWLFALLGIVTVGHGLVVAARRRRHDLAILRTLGLSPGRGAALVAWQAATVGIVAVVAGVPLGLLAGRLAWSTLSQQLGIVPTLVVPLVAIAAVVIGALLAAVTVVAIPARAVARLRLGEALRSE